MSERGMDSPKGEIVLYLTSDGEARLECRFENESIWLTQALVAQLYQKDVRTINEHLRNIYAEEELSPEATVRKSRMVQTEGCVAGLDPDSIIDIIIV